MRSYSSIIQQAGNEFVLEFDKQATAQELKEGVEFEYESVKYRVVRAYPGVALPGCYTFLVITESL